MTRWGAAVLARLELRGDETVLDAGAGSGRVTEMLLERLPHGRVVALDAAPSMLAEARQAPGALRRPSPFRRERPPRARARPISGAMHRSTPLLSTATFHWVLDHDRLFANLAAVMRPGAALEAQCGAAGNIAGLIEAVRTTGTDRVGRVVLRDPAGHNRPAAPRRVRRRRGVDPPRADAPGRRRGARDLSRDGVPADPRGGDGPGERAPLVPARGGEAMPEPVIDYVRLNISARRRS